MDGEYEDLNLANRGGRIREIINGTAKMDPAKRQAYLDRWNSWPAVIRITKDQMQEIERRNDTPSLPCQYRGEIVRTALCQLCSTRQIKYEVYACQKHGECSLLKRDSKLTCCISCRDRHQP